MADRGQKKNTILSRREQEFCINLLRKISWRERFEQGLAEWYNLDRLKGWGREYYIGIYFMDINSKSLICIYFGQGVLWLLWLLIIYIGWNQNDSKMKSN